MNVAADKQIAFIDCTMTGQLASRMTNDVATVAQPAQPFLNQFLTSLLQYVGGSIMCFAVSWKLTVLAGTLIGPVIYVTHVYAKWCNRSFSSACC